MGCIYSILNKVNGKIYVGLTIDVKRRFKEHKSELRSGIHYNSHLQRAWNKYGEDAFEFNVLEYCSDDKLSDNESWWIDYFDSTNKLKGYNQITGGKCNNGSANPMYNKHHSIESRKKMSESRKGKHTGEDNHFYGKKHSLESRKKMSESRTGEKNHKWGTSIIDEYGGLWFIKTMASTGISLRELSRCLGIYRKTIPNYLRNRGTSWTEIVNDVNG